MKITKSQIAKETVVKRVSFGFYSYFFSTRDANGTRFEFFRNANTDVAFVNSHSFEFGEELLARGIENKTDFVDAVQDYISQVF